MIEEINRVERKHILVVESPIEYLFANRMSFIRQREVHQHTPSFEQALVDGLRENPDVFVVGEMRTPDVMRLTLNAAETGHLVLATLHSASCAEALSRICMSFASEIQAGIRAQLADCLVGVVCQRLLYLPDERLQVPHCEILTASSAARANIRSGQMSQISSTLQTGGEDGMWSFDRYQKWISQKRDWVRPSQAAPLVDRPDPSATMPKSPILTGMRKSRGAKVKDSDAELASGRMEIDAAEDSLPDLAKLASQIGDDEE